MKARGFLVGVTYVQHSEGYLPALAVERAVVAALQGLSSSVQLVEAAVLADVNEVELNTNLDGLNVRDAVPAVEEPAVSEPEPSPQDAPVVTGVLGSLPGARVLSFPVPVSDAPGSDTEAVEPAADTFHRAWNL